MTTITTAAIDARKGISPAEVAAVHARPSSQACSEDDDGVRPWPSFECGRFAIVIELMHRRMRYDPQDRGAANDRLVLSVGHAVPIIYAYADLGGGRTEQNRRDASTDV